MDRKKEAENVETTRMQAKYMNKEKTVCHDRMLQCTVLLLCALFGTKARKNASQ